MAIQLHLLPTIYLLTNGDCPQFFCHNFRNNKSTQTIASYVRIKNLWHTPVIPRIPATVSSNLASWEIHQKWGHGGRTIRKITYKQLVGGLEHVVFLYIGNVIIPTDELIFFRGVGLNHQPDSVVSSTPCLMTPEGKPTM